MRTNGLRFPLETRSFGIRGLTTMHATKTYSSLTLQARNATGGGVNADATSAIQTTGDAI